MPRCKHTWGPLVAIDPAPMTPDTRLTVSFSLAMSRLDGYDRCTACGRLSWIRNSRAQRRSLVSIDTTDIERRAAEKESEEVGRWLMGVMMSQVSKCQCNSLSARNAGSSRYRLCELCQD